MAMGKRDTERQQDLFLTHDKLPRSPGHVLYDKLNGLLRAEDFAPTSKPSAGRTTRKARAAPPVPPGVYFRLLLVG
jgi:hypothetical protein